MPNVSLDKALHIVAQGREAAEKNGLKAVFAILDTGANLVAFSRMDGAWLASNELAMAKARTSVMFQMPSEVLNAPLQVGQSVAHFDHIHAGGLLLMGGGLPLFDEDGVLAGALGVSGGTPEEDAALARSAAD
ncbi:GlcG/HbpS family heme-binding protein [Ottowia thiooxydans]|uniref:GlcG/HbpS family heme-binding protein n=1 Tax=Ottowia thiooxydans TaxID=219182 RepID=UPI0004278229|nr:heme-binding protein [Ottowia thiooxydans]